MTTYFNLYFDQWYCINIMPMSRTATVNRKTRKSWSLEIEESRS